MTPELLFDGANVIVALIESAIGLLLAIAGVVKLQNPAAFQRGLRPLPWMSAGTSWVVAILVPSLELALAVGLFFGQRLAVFGTIVLLTVFSLVAFNVVLRRLKVQCHCFGATDETLSAATIRRNMLLIVLMMTCLLRPSGLLSLEELFHGGIALALWVCVSAFMASDRQIRHLISLGGLPRTLS